MKNHGLFQLCNDLGSLEAIEGTSSLLLNADLNVSLKDQTFPVVDAAVLLANRNIALDYGCVVLVVWTVVMTLNHETQSPMAFGEAGSLLGATELLSSSSIVVDTILSFIEAIEIAALPPSHDTRCSETHQDENNLSHNRIYLIL